MSNMVIMIGEAAYELLDGHTLDEVRAAAAADPPAKGLCRLRHRWETIGKPYTDGDVMQAVLTLVATRHTRDLAMCKRCGRVGLAPAP